MRLRRLLPADLRGQVAGILLIGLALSQLMAAVLYAVMLPKWQRVLRPDVAVARVEMLVRIFESVDPQTRAMLAHQWSDETFQLRYHANASPNEGPPPLASDSPELRDLIAARLGKDRKDVSVETGLAAHLPGSTQILVVLRGGGALDVLTSIGIEHPLGLVEQLGLSAFLIFSTVALWVWLTLMVTVPLTRVARAAERVGMDINAPVLAPQGPTQLQRVIKAFNDMQLRLQRLLTDRTLMLGAISHDLRTPLTRLRLRVETDRAIIEKAKMLADIETMEMMLGSGLSFVRGVDDAEAQDAVDLASLLQTACDMISDVGGEVVYVGPERCRYHCKPQALLRAFTNIIMNAVKYGKRARVTLQKTPDSGFLVDIEDQGPGLSNADKVKAFEPFYRAAAARELDSQGMGLGLAIARSVILAHGGTIELCNRKPHGLRVSITLPEASS
jgi:signal transduction histidine kinase